MSKPRRTDFIGSLGRNKYKTKPNHPPYKGAATIDGVKYWLSAWVNENRDTGQPYFKLYFEPKKDSDSASDSTPDPAPLADQPDIPF